MNKSSNLRKMDNVEFESRYSSNHGIRYNDIKKSNISFEEMRPFIYMLPDKEIDLIELYYMFEKNQKDIAKMFDVTQGAISSRLSRARQRLIFLRDIPKISEEEIEKELDKFFDVMEIEIIKFMKRTTCQSKTAELINEKFKLVEKERMTQVKVRHRFEKCIGRLKLLTKTNPSLKKYSDLLLFLKDNLYLMHEVHLPHFCRSNRAIFSLNS